jgi:hypothetical protein
VRDVACTASDEVDMAIANADLAHEHQLHLSRMQTIVDGQTQDLANAQVHLTAHLGNLSRPGQLTPLLFDTHTYTHTHTHTRTHTRTHTHARWSSKAFVGTLR